MLIFTHLPINIMENGRLISLPVDVVYMNNQALSTPNLDVKCVKRTPMAS